MELLARSQVREDVLPLQRAMRAPEDARRSLKRFGSLGSVEKDAKRRPSNPERELTKSSIKFTGHYACQASAHY